MCANEALAYQISSYSVVVWLILMYDRYSAITHSPIGVWMQRVLN